MTNLNHSDDNDLLVALGHPLRRQILQEMAGRKTTSPCDLARVLEQPLTNISYHVRVLARCAAVNLVATKPTRGSMQHFYCSTVEAPWARLVLGLDDPNGGAAGESSDDPGT